MQSAAKSISRILALGLSLIYTPLLMAGEPCSSDHPIYCAIKTIRPDIDDQFAMELSNYIHTSSQKYGTNPMRTVAIIAQESMFRNVHRRHTVLELQEDCSSGTCIEYMRKVRGYTDIGLYQFHAATIEAFGMDALRLREDIKYATDRHCFLLSVKVKECADLGKNAWACYHSRTTKYRNKYIKMVNRYYEKIKETRHGND